VILIKHLIFFQLFP